MPLLFIQSCRSDKPPGWAPFFATTALSDTLFVKVHGEEDHPGREIPATVFMAALDTALIARMIYPPDPNDMQVYGRWVAPVDQAHEVYLVEVRQNWFIFNYLFLFSKQAKEITDVLPLAQFYGGDGGQILTESLLFDWENKHSPKILTRMSEHALILLNDDLTDSYQESVSLREWNGVRFQELPIPDSSRWIRAYPIQW